MNHKFTKTTDPLIKQPPEEDYGMNSPSSKSELIEPMIFDCGSSKSELIEPMIFNCGSSKSELIEPMIFDKSLPGSKNAVPIIPDNPPFIPKPLNDQIQQELKPRVGSTSDLEYGISLSKKHEIPNCLCEADTRSNVVHPNMKKDIRPTAYSIAKTLMNKVALCVYNNQLLYYTGRYYKKISDPDIKRLIISECRTDVERSGTAKILSDTVEFLLHEPQLLKNYDENKAKISFLNCVLDVETGIVYPHHPSIFTTYCIECNYSNNTYSPIFDNFLMQITGEDQGIIQRIFELIGYVLTPDTGGKVFFVLQGCPNSGKSVLSALITSFFDSESVSAMDIHSLHRQFAPSELADKVICVSPDLPSGIIDDKSVSKLKQFTGNDLVSADRKNKNFIQFKCKARFILATNHILLTKEADPAFYERAIAIPFKYSIPKEKRNPHLLELLKVERDAIAAKAIAAYHELKKHNYCFSGFYELNSADFLHESEKPDIYTCVYDFARNNFVEDENGRVFIKHAYDAFSSLSEDLSLEVFSKIFSTCTAQVFNAVNTGKKARLKNSKNPLHYISGIKWREY